MLWKGSKTLFLKYVFLLTQFWSKADEMLSTKKLNLSVITLLSPKANEIMPKCNWYVRRLTFIAVCRERSSWHLHISSLICITFICNIFIGEKNKNRPICVSSHIFLSSQSGQKQPWSRPITALPAWASFCFPPSVI